MPEFTDGINFNGCQALFNQHQHQHQYQYQTTHPFHRPYTLTPLLTKKSAPINYLSEHLSTPPPCASFFYPVQPRVRLSIPAMSASTNKTEANSSQQPTQQKQNPQVLEEDDEFEDFPVEGKLCISRWCGCDSCMNRLFQGPEALNRFSHFSYIYVLYWISI